jgi:hypothetical protein
MIHHVSKLLRLTVGAVLILVGLLLSLPGIPGPGVLVVILGLSMLSTDVELARRMMEWLKRTSRRTVDRWRGTDAAG